MNAPAQNYGRQYGAGRNGYGAFGSGYGADSNAGADALKHDLFDALAGRRRFLPADLAPQ